MPEHFFLPFVATKPGEAYRLFEFGPLHKGGRKRVITPEYAATFKLPHFKPPIKLGSHAETTPAGGHIIGLEVRADGLYAVPELVPAGETALRDGAYRYHSPEAIFDGSLEDPATGQMIPGPFIVGDAWLHTPHLGESAALYSHEGEDMETVTVPKPLFERFTAWLDGLGKAPEPPPAPKEDFAAQLAEKEAEIERFKAEAAQRQAEADRLARITTLSGELQNTERFGAMYVEVKGATEAAEVLAGMTDEQREWVMRNFAAHAAQLKDAAALARNPGQPPRGASADAVAAFDAAIQAHMGAVKSTYPEAAAAVAQAQPELYTAYLAAQKEK